MERIEAEAWIQLQLAPPLAFQEQFGIEVHCRGSGVLLLARHTEFPAFNRAVGLGFDRPLDETALDDVVSLYRDAGVKLFIVQWCPEAAPGDAPRLLESRGFRAGSRMAKLCRHTSDPPPAVPGIDVVQVGADRADELAAILIQGHGNDPRLQPGFTSTMGMAGWRHYLAFEGGRAIAGAALYASGDMAWCGMAATLESHRNRGAHRALLAQRVRDAADLGCSWISCETMEDTAERPNPSFRNMCRVGFEAVYLRTNFIFDTPPA